MDPQSSENPLSRLASRQHGVVTREQLLAAGASRQQIKDRVQSGRLIRVHRGVYRVGHSAPSMEAIYMAAVKACGGRALLAGRSAARLHCLFRGSWPQAEVVTPSERRVSGVLTRRAAWNPADATIHRSIPVTTVPRTLVDLAAVLSPPHLARAVHEASVLHDVGPDEIEAILARRHNWPGCRELRAVLHGDTPVTLSRMESEFLRLLRDAGLPQPRANGPVDGRYVDCRWPAQRLTVELDGYRYHRTRRAWERDRAREREARARGDDFRRYTYADVVEDPRAMLRELRECLAVQERSGSNRPPPSSGGSARGPSG